MVDHKSLAHQSSRRTVVSAGCLDAEAVNRWLLNAIAGAWRHYPGAVDLSFGTIADQHDVARAVVERLVQQGIVERRGPGIALTKAGCAAVDHAARADGRFSDLLRAGRLPEPPAGSSLVLAVLRARFELDRGTDGR